MEKDESSELMVWEDSEESEKAPAAPAKKPRKNGHMAKCLFDLRRQEYDDLCRCLSKYIWADDSYADEIYEDSPFADSMKTHDIPKPIVKGILEFINEKRQAGRSKKLAELGQKKKAYQRCLCDLLTASTQFRWKGERMDHYSDFALSPQGVPTISIGTSYGPEAFRPVFKVVCNAGMFFYGWERSDQSDHDPIDSDVFDEGTAHRDRPRLLDINAYRKNPVPSLRSMAVFALAGHMVNGAYTRPSLQVIMQTCADLFGYQFKPTEAAPPPPKPTQKRKRNEGNDTEKQKKAKKE